ncbi:probable acyl-CoA dehydrogenase 6 [Hydra vulgaris]|uniref:Probable acyl-CoA dehydrogenase 6 n=1 Tax=Hydra vulgaris TaxID=6087 RepID=A0ABM4DIL1_HYDVU
MGALRLSKRVIALSKRTSCLITKNAFQTKASEEGITKKVKLFETPLEVSDSLSDESIFTPEHVELRRALRKLLEKEIIPHVNCWEEAGGFPAHKVFKTLGSAGFLGVNKPVEYGGLGLDFSFTMAVHEEMGNIPCGALPMAIGVQADMCTPALTNFGSDELKKLFLAPNIAGDIVGCLGVSEVGAGSDVSAIKTTAVKRGDDYVINGGKMWTTNGAQADWMCLLANTSEGQNPHLNKSLICVPMKTKGIVVQPRMKKLGMHSSDTVQIFFEDVVVPQKYRIGEEGLGFVYQMKQFQDERLVGSVSALAICDRCIRQTANYCHQRKAFGKTLLSNQVIHFKLAELQTEVEMLRSTIYRATDLYVKGKDVTYLASMCKLKAGRLLREVTDACLQYWGGMGYMEGEISRAFRDSRLVSIGGGADEVMLSIICKYMDTLPSSR